MFVVISEDGQFRTANYSKQAPLTKEAVKLIAKHIDQWAESFEEDEE